MNAYMRQIFKVGCWLLLATCVSFIGINFVRADKVAAAEPQKITFYGSVQSSISSSVAVPAKQAYLWTSGTVPPVTNGRNSRCSRSLWRYEAQATGIIQQIDTVLSWPPA
jgi:hypothetical protein